MLDKMYRVKLIVESNKLFSNEYSDVRIVDRDKVFDTIAQLNAKVTKRTGPGDTCEKWVRISWYIDQLTDEEMEIYEAIKAEMLNK